MDSPPLHSDAKTDLNRPPTNSGTAQAYIDMLIAFNSVILKKTCMISYAYMLEVPGSRKRQNHAGKRPKKKLVLCNPH